MSGTQLTILWMYAALIAIWPVRLIVLGIILRRQEFLDPASPQYNLADPPLVSAILPAKDEESNLRGCLNSVCRQTYPNLEVLVVDDRSTDRTNAIAWEFARRDPRIQVLKIDHLPGAGPGRPTRSRSPRRRHEGSGFGSWTPTRSMHPRASRS